MLMCLCLPGNNLNVHNKTEKFGLSRDTTGILIGLLKVNAAEHTKLIQNITLGHCLLQRGTLVYLCTLSVNATSHSVSGCCKRAFSALEHAHHSLHQDEWLLMSTEEYSVLLLYHIHLATGCSRTSFSTLSTYRSPIYYE